VHEVPRPQSPLLPLDEQQALAGEDEEVLLHLLAVVHAVRLARVQDDQADRDLGEGALAGLEPAFLAELVVVPPARIGRVDDEPAVGLRLQAARRLAHAGLGDGHG
jgi:hypothetical protein